MPATMTGAIFMILCTVREKTAELVISAYTSSSLPQTVAKCITLAHVQ